MLALCVAQPHLAAAGDKCGNWVVTYYLQQEFGQTELLMVAAARPAVNGTATGFGLEIVYEFVMTSTADPASDVMGYVRGTAVVVNNTAAATVFFASNVVHYEYGGVNGTFSQQGEAVFSRPPWEYAVVGGTGDFRRVQGYNVGTFISSSPTPSGSRHIVTYYEAHLCRLGDD
ncbi:hypothetical protein L7F22_048069 [Adiantum nelumboides]|nr:hypothetical protein [Adiantum nelumboides]MCO5594049.1 hypothetical protein [Adiantum nelumboides]